MPLSPQQRRYFDERGYLLLEHAISRVQLRALQTRIAENLSHQGIAMSSRSVPPAMKQLPIFQQIGKLSELASRRGLDALPVLSTVAPTVEELARCKVTSHQAMLLISPPRQGSWSLEGLNWHTDVPSTGHHPSGIQAFVLVRDLKHHAGATLVLAGSHLRQGDDRARSRVRAAVSQGRVDEARLRELGLSIVELSGRAGDIYLMDMRALHTPSTNASDDWRVVVTVRFFVA